LPAPIEVGRLPGCSLSSDDGDCMIEGGDRATTEGTFLHRSCRGFDRRHRWRLPADGRLSTQGHRQSRANSRRPTSSIARRCFSASVGPDPGNLTSV